MWRFGAVCGQNIGSAPDVLAATAYRFRIVRTEVDFFTFAQYNGKCQTGD